MKKCVMMWFLLFGGCGVDNTGVVEVNDAMCYEDVPICFLMKRMLDESKEQYGDAPVTCMICTGENHYSETCSRIIDHGKAAATITCTTCTSCTYKYVQYDKWGNPQ